MIDWLATSSSERPPRCFHDERLSECGGHDTVIVQTPACSDSKAVPRDFAHFQTRSGSSTDGPEHMTQNRPDPNWFWLTMSGFGQTDPVRKQAGVQESAGEILAYASEPIRIVGC